MDDISRELLKIAKVLVSRDSYEVKVWSHDVSQNGYDGEMELEEDFGKYNSLDAMINDSSLWRDIKSVSSGWGATGGGEWEFERDMDGGGPFYVTIVELIIERNGKGLSRDEVKLMESVMKKNGIRT